MIFEAIVVTGTPFSGKTTLAKILAEHFGWKYFSVGEMWKAMWREKFPEGETGFPNWWRETTDKQNQEMDNYAHEIVKQGHVVADLRYGFLHRDPMVLIIRTKCDIDTRAKRALEIGRYPGKDFVQIKEILEQRERDEVERSMKLYSQDYRSEKNYDLVFDTTHAAPDEAIQKILDLSDSH